jgi:putative FmdB family regulatory protein
VRHAHRRLSQQPVPIYDYICGVCGERTEVIHGIDAPGPRFCPACGAESTLRKAFVAPNVHFKGSGWAKKDRSTASRANARTDSEGTSAGGGGTGETHTDGGKAGDKSSGPTPAGSPGGDGDSPKSGPKSDAAKGGSTAAGAGKD